MTTQLAYIESDGEGRLRLDYDSDSRKIEAVKADGSVSHALEPQFEDVAEAEDYIKASYNSQTWGLEWIERAV